MRNIRISDDDADRLSRAQEGHFLDRKALAISGKKVQKVTVAFANADGGELYVGIADDKDQPDPLKRWNGATKPEDVNGLLQALFEVTPTLHMTYDALFCDIYQGYVLRVAVEKSSEVHRTSDNKVYQRFGAQSLPIDDPQRVLELSYAKGAASFEDQGVIGLKPEVVVDAPELQRFLNEYSPKTDPLDFAINQHLLDNASWQPIVAAALLFAPNPSAALPRKCAVKVVRYDTNEEQPEREHLKEQFTVEGPLYPLIHDAITRITEVMSGIRIWTDDGLKNVSYPPEAIWEIVVNAIIHRDYSISDDVQVQIFNNRIEVLSPGRLPGYVNVENILEARYSRNPKVVRALNRYPAPPNRDMGEGLNTAFQKMKEWKLRPPVIREDGNYVRVTIPHTPLATPEDAILEFLRKNGVIKNYRARDLTGIRSENAVKRVFLKLRDAGLIERVPELRGSAAQWRIVKNEA